MFHLSQEKALKLILFAFMISAFYLFKVNTITSNNAPQREAFKLLYYFKLTKLKEVRKLVIRARIDLLLADRIKFKLVLAVP